MKDSGVKKKASNRQSDTAEQFIFHRDDAVTSEFVARMGETITDLYGKEFGQAEEGTPPCAHCRFIDFCRRMVPKTNF